VVVVGAGPAGLSAAIRLKQQALKAGKEINVCVVEKGAEVGSHILSGNVFEPIALNELIPDWKEKGAPLNTPCTEDHFYFLTKQHAIPLPTPPTQHNTGNYVISLGNLVRWLGQQAEELGVEIYPGFSAAEVLYDEGGAVAGIATSDVGIGKDGKRKEGFQRGMELRAKQTLFAEGVRGSLSELVMKKYELRKDCDPQSYGLGIKETWEIQPEKFKAGLTMHTIGFPADTQTWEGSFMYHMTEPNIVQVGLVVSLDYQNPYLSPYQEFQKFKTHPKIAHFLEGGKVLGYGARCINEGGLQSIPKLTFPGGALVGCSAGFLNVAKIKGTHTAMKSGMLAADAIFDKFDKGVELQGAEVADYEGSLKNSWVYEELYKVRNIQPSFRFGGMIPFLLYSAFDTYILRGKAPWTFGHDELDWQTTKKLSESTPIEYPKPDGVLTFDLLTNLQRSGTFHNEDQPSHLKIKPELEDAALEGYKKYGGVEGRFCPAKVYEWLEDSEGKPHLQINKANCVHCKSCDIKPYKNFIQWTVPEGGGGPKYENM